MRHATILQHWAVLVRHWFEIGPDDTEHGARIELRVLEHVPHQGSESASQPLAFGPPIWRADLFDLIGARPGNMMRAHYHARFDGYEPMAREWDEALTRDPLSWLAAQLSDMSPVIERSGFGGDHVQESAREIAAAASGILRLAQQHVGALCRTSAQCLAQTSDTTEIIGMMLALFRPGSQDPRLAASDQPVDGP